MAKRERPEERTGLCVKDGESEEKKIMKDKETYKRNGMRDGRLKDG